MLIKSLILKVADFGNFVSKIRREYIRAAQLSSVSLAVNMEHSCPFCSRKYPSSLDLVKHKYKEHKEAMFRCVACTEVVTLFDTYREVIEHAAEAHRVSVESAAQSSVFLPERKSKYK